MDEGLKMVNDISGYGKSVLKTIEYMWKYPQDVVSLVNRPLYDQICRAYIKMKMMNWDSIYWAIDLHDTVLVPNYLSLEEQTRTGNYEKAFPKAVEVMRWLMQFPETKIILWSSTPKKTLEYHKEWIFGKWNIAPNRVFINENPEVISSAAGADFSNKFYFNLLLDDKAGFEPEYDWDTIFLAVESCQLTKGK